MNYSTPRTEATAIGPSQFPAECDSGLCLQQTGNSPLTSAQYDRELELHHLQEQATGSRKRVRRIILKPFQLLGSAVKHATRSCFRGNPQEMGGEIFIRAHIVDGRTIQSRNERDLHEDRAVGSRMNKEEDQPLRQHEMESSKELEVGPQLSESAKDECESPRSSDAVGEPSFAEICREQSMIEGPPLQEKPDGFGTDGAEPYPRLLDGENETSFASSPPLSRHGTDEEEQEARSGSSSQSFEKQVKRNDKSRADCEPEAALANSSAPEDRNDTDLTLLGQTEAEFMEMVCSAVPFLDDEGSLELAEGEDSSDEESFWDSDHSSLAGSSSADGEWDEDVVVFSRASRLLSSAQRTAVGGCCE